MVPTISRRQFMMLGGITTASIWMPRGLISEASAQTESFDFYISPNGSDQNPGTLSQPWAITALNTKRSTYSGKRVGLLDGTYRIYDSFGNNTSYDNNHIMVEGGSASAPTIIKAVNRHKAILDGQRSTLGTSAKKGGLIGPMGDYVTIDGLKIQNTNYLSMCNYYTYWSGGGNYFTVQNCWFRDQYYISGNNGGENSATLFMQGKHHCTVRNCRFEEAGAPSDLDRHSFIQFYACDETLVEYNTIIGNGGQAQGYPGVSGNGIHCKGNVDSVSSRPGKHYTIRRNFIDNTAVGNTSTGIQFHASDDDFTSMDGDEYIQGNIIVTRSGSPFFLGGCRNNLHIQNNTFVVLLSSNSAILDRLDGEARGNLYPPASIEISKNILTRSATGSDTDIYLGPLSTLGAVDYNLYDASCVLRYNRGANSATGLSNWRAVSGKDAHSVESGDTQFTGSGVDAAKYQLRSGSLAKTLAAGAEVGAWAGATQVGCSFSASAAPQPPASITVS